MADLSSELLDELGQLQSCAVANAIEKFDVRPWNEGFMSPQVKCMFPELGGMIGYAVTGVIRADRPATDRMQVTRLDWVDEILKIPEPRVVVLQGPRRAQPRRLLLGRGAEQRPTRRSDASARSPTAAVRDLDEMRELSFRAFASQPLVSHAYVHLVDERNVPVTVGGLNRQPRRPAPRRPSTA